MGGGNVASVSSFFLLFNISVLLAVLFCVFFFIYFLVKTLNFYDTMRALKNEELFKLDQIVERMDLKNKE